MTQMLTVSIVLVNTPRKRRPVTRCHLLLLLLPMANAPTALLGAAKMDGHVLHTSRNVLPVVAMAISGVPKHAKSQKSSKHSSATNCVMIVMILPLSPVHLRNQGAPLQQRNGQKVLRILKLMENQSLSICWSHSSMPPLQNSQSPAMVSSHCHDNGVSGPSVC